MTDPRTEQAMLYLIKAVDNLAQATAIQNTPPEKFLGLLGPGPAISAELDKCRSNLEAALRALGAK